MKKLNSLKSINTNFINKIHELHSELQKNIKEAKQEYQQNLIDEKNKLLITICQGEKLDLDEMKLKYLNQKEINSINIERTNDDIIENLLNKIRIDDQDYYYESQQDGKVFNISNEVVGIFKNGKIILD